MKSVSRLALGAALAIGATGVLFPAPADAQRAPRPGQQQARPAQVQAQGRTLNLNAQERTALVALEAATRGTDVAAQDAALAAARGVVRGADARYAFHGFQYNIARSRGEAGTPMLLEAIEGLLASGQVPQAEQAGYLTVQYQIGMRTQQWPVAERAGRRLLELNPNDAELLGNLASIRMQQGAREEGMQFLQRAIAVRQAAGQPIPEAWLRFALRDAYESRNPAVRARSAGIARQLVTAAPTPENWRDALLILRETGQYDAAAQLDIWRLAMQAGALAGERDYFDFANALNQGGYPAEAKSVLDAGVSRRMIDPARSPFRELISSSGARIAADRADLPASQRTALAAATGTAALRTGDAFFGHGRYTDAIALYQAALTKGGVDANVVNTRLGIAYALAGQRVPAEAAFRAVTGPRAEIAQFWLTWLARRP